MDDMGAIATLAILCLLAFVGIMAISAWAVKPRSRQIVTNDQAHLLAPIKTRKCPPYRLIYLLPDKTRVRVFSERLPPINGKDESFFVFDGECYLILSCMQTVDGDMHAYLIHLQWIMKESDL